MPVCLIPARSGSKRIPGKNVLPIRGRPMMHWPALAALKAGCFTNVIVSTDSFEYAEIAREIPGVEAHIRPSELADDMTPLEAVLADAMARFAGEEWCMLLATAIDVTPIQIREAHMLLRGAPVVAVARDRQSADRALCDTDDGHLTPVSRDGIRKRTQDCRISYHDVGAFYWVSRRNFWWRWALLRQDILLQYPVPYVVTGMVDLDTPEDMEAAGA